MFGPHALVASDALGKITLYDDFDCEHPSTLNPTVNLSVSTCLVTTGGEGLVIDELPPCSSTTATLIYYSDPACGQQTNDVSTAIASDSCFQLAAGTDLFNAKAVMFSCQPAANNPQPSSTSTAVVSLLAAVATGSTGSDGSGSSTSVAGSTPTDTSTTQNNGTGSGGSNSNGGIGTSTSSGSGLDTGDIIALAVGLGTGITAIAVAVAAWRFPVFRDQLKRTIPGWRDQPTFHSHGAPPWHHNEPQNIDPRQHHYNQPQEMRPWQQHYNRPQEMDARQQHYSSPVEIDSRQQSFHTH